MRRRDLIFGVTGVAALATAEALRPRRRVRLLQGATIETALPMSFGEWSAVRSADYIGPELSGKVTKALYSEIVPRTYYNDETGDAVMMLAAYGDTQSDLLQLHRPEFCYPAVGFNLRANRAAMIPIAAGVQLPARKVVAFTSDRVENILYWTRLGEDLPQSASEQRTTRIRQSIEGVVPDGILMRLSVVGESEAAYAMLDKFVPLMLRAMPVSRRRAFVGTRLAQALG